MSWAEDKYQSYWRTWNANNAAIGAYKPYVYLSNGDVSREPPARPGAGEWDGTILDDYAYHENA